MSKTNTGQYRSSRARKAVSGLLAAVMLMSMIPAGAFASESGSAAEGGLGEVRLVIHHAIRDSGSGFTATLTKGGDSASLPMNAEGESVTGGIYRGLQNGTWKLTVEGSHYVTYEQDIEVADDCSTITLYNDDMVNRGRLDSHFGVITLGDFTDDGKIDDSDADLVRENEGTENLEYDMNSDGEVDLTDLALVVRNQAGNVPASIIHTASSLALAKTAKAETSGKAQIQGEAQSVEEAVLTSAPDSYVSFAPADEGKPVSEDNPVEIGLSLTGEDEGPDAAGTVEAEAITIAPPADPANAIAAGSVDVTASVGGQDVVYHAAIEKKATEAIRSRIAFAGGGATGGEADVSVESDGTIVIDIGSKVAVKKVKIRVTETMSGGTLADIASVQFLDDFAERIPEPELSIPTISGASNTEGEYKELTFSWDAQQNITGYEVSISGPNVSVTRTVAASDGTSYTYVSDSFNGAVKAFEDYELRVRSVNGSWRSDWSDVYTHRVTCSAKPGAPEKVNATGDVYSINVTWGEVFDTQYWSLFWRQKAGAGDWTEVPNLQSPSYTLGGLESGVTYEIYIVGHNENGASPVSPTVEATALSAEGTELPKYGLINRNDDDHQLSKNHITEIKGVNEKSYTIYKDGGQSVSNTEATPADWDAIVDSRPETYLYITDWDSGVNYDFSFRGPKIQLDGKYTVGAVRIAPSASCKHDMNIIRIGARQNDGSMRTIETEFSRKYDSQNHRFYEAVLDEPVTTDYIEVYTTSSYGASQPISIAELGIYEYDSLLDDAEALFTDETEIELLPDVGMDDIQALRTRVETPDEETGEMHPSASVITELLNYAEQLLNDGMQDEVYNVDNTITSTADGHLGFSQSLSDLQPLGYVAEAGADLIVYVGSPTEPRGSNASLKLTVTQYHPEVNRWHNDVLQLKVGRNQVKVPTLTSAQKEKGGSIYVWYGSTPGAKNYTVRVKGAQKIPVLNAGGLTGDDRHTAIEQYITALEAYVPEIENLHSTLHLNGSDSVNYIYDETECFLNSTEIIMNDMFYSVPATEVLKALGLNHDARVKALETAIAGMEQEIELFYQFKGLNRQAASNDTDRWPRERLNIRYSQMFTGAFMFAAGKHIGIEYGSVKGLFGTEPVTVDEKGDRVSGYYSGWGYAHEIGHVINSRAYQRVEVTNNVFAQLAQTDDTDETFRTSYDKVYKAVAAGNTGHTGDLAVQLAMYWQLHLAYDDCGSYELFDSAEEQMNSLFYARVDSYLRNRAKGDAAVKAAGIENAALDLTGDSDQNFMRVCVAAAQKNMLDFFRAWGFTPDAVTAEYASHFPKEDRPIQFITDDCRTYRRQQKSGMPEDTTVTAEITNAEDSRITSSNQVVISLANSCSDPDAMLGYEIFRNGRLAAFVTADETSYTDIIATENNKAFVYTVVGVDKLLQTTEPAVLAEVKVCHDGAIDKTGWTGETTLRSTEDRTVAAGEDGYCEETYISAIPRVFDGDTQSVYYGTIENSGVESADIIINLGGMQQITALKYTPGGENGVQNYTISVSTDGETWEQVKEGTFSNEDTETVFFNKMLPDGGGMDPWMYVYDASFLKLTAVGQKSVSLAELDILGPTSDNIELIGSGFGKLSKAFKYSDTPNEDGTPSEIPEGSIVFFGEYRGDPSYSVVLLKDQNGRIINGDQIIMAQVTPTGALGSTSDGRYFYWLENEQALEDIESVQAELYRVSDALTNAGERLTSTTLHFDIPDEIPSVEIRSDASDASAVRSSDLLPLLLQPETGDETETQENSSAAEAGFAETGETVSAEPAGYSIEVSDELLEFTADEETGTALISQVPPAPAASAPVVLELDDLAHTADITLYASEQPAAMHVRISITGEAASRIEQSMFQWNSATADMYLAGVWNGTDALDLYAVSRRGALGSTSAENQHTEVVSATLDLSSLTDVEGILTFRSDKADYVSPIYNAYQHDANVEEVMSFQTIAPPEGGGDGSLEGGDPECEHKTTHHVEVPASCTEAGYTADVCDECGGLLNKEVIPALGHDFGDTNKCRRCGASRYGDACPDGHTPDENGFCTVCGHQDPEWMKENRLIHVSGDDLDFTEIQHALNWINTQTEDKTEWTVEVADGEYDRFLVFKDMTGLTLKAKDDGNGTKPVVNVLCDTDSIIDVDVYDDAHGNKDQILSYAYRADGRGSIVLADDVSVSGFDFRAGTARGAWGGYLYSGALQFGGGYQPEHGPDGVTVENCSFTGEGINKAVAFIDSGSSSFTVKNCTFDDMEDAVWQDNPGGAPVDIEVTGNTFTGMNHALYMTFGDKLESSPSEGKLLFTGNTVNGTAEQNTAVTVLDLSAGTELATADITGNTFKHTDIFQHGLDAHDGAVHVLDSNTADRYSIYIGIEDKDQSTGTVDAVMQASKAMTSGLWVISAGAVRHDCTEKFTDWAEKDSKTLVEYAADRITAANTERSYVLTLEDLKADRIASITEWLHDCIWFDERSADDICNGKHTWDAETGKCKVCGTAHNHKDTMGNIQDYKPATCTEDGMTGGTYCTVCGWVESEPQVIPHQGHNFVNEECTVCGARDEHKPVEVYEEPTCTAHGWKKSVCSVCGEVLSSEQIPMKPHKWNSANGTCDVCGTACTHDETHPYGENIEPDCTHTGKAQGEICDICGMTVIPEKELPAKGHTPDEEFGEAVEPDCLNTGMTVGYKCSVCHEVIHEPQVIPALGHDYEDGNCIRCQAPDPHCSHENVRDLIEPKAATCTEAGWTAGEWCETCETVLSPSEPVDALGHDLDENGKCSRCDYQCPHSEWSEDGKCLECGKVCTHEWDVLDGTCTVCGMQCSHEYLEEHTVHPTCIEDGHTQQVCQVCGMVIGEPEILEATGHKWVNGECGVCGEKCHHTDIESVGWDKPATCTEPGSSAGQTCRICGHVIKAAYTIPAKGHVSDLPAGEAKEPTCMEEGLTAGKKCSVCGEITEEQHVIPKVGHKFDGSGSCAYGCGTPDPDCDHSEVTVTVPAKEPTCTEPGNTEGSICAKCGASIHDAEEIPATGHTLLSRNAKEPTCTEHGLTEEIFCTVCGAVTQESVEIPALEHIVKHLEAVDPTCTDPGKTAGSVCERCGETLVEQEFIDSLGHSWNEENKCDRCGIDHPDAGKCLGDDHKGELVSDDNAVAPTCTEHGWTASEHCSVCGHTVVHQQEIPALGHDFKDGKCTRCGAVDPDWTPSEPAPEPGGGNSGNSGSSGGSSSGSSRTWNVVVEDAEGGTIKVSRTKASSGTKITVTPVPDTGYELETIEVINSRTEKAIKLTENKDGTYAFTMPSANAAVYATFRKTGADAPADVTVPYTDVSKDAWYYEAVCAMYANDIMTGVTPSTFVPDGILTRAELTVMLYRLDQRRGGGKPGTGVPFTDVASGEWYFNAVNWAYATGMVKGVSETEFAPSRPITRQEMAVMLYRYAQNSGLAAKPDEASLASFTDAGSIAAWAREAMSWAVSSGIMNGTGDSMLSPEGTATRAQIAQLFSGFIKAYPDMLKTVESTDAEQSGQEQEQEQEKAEG